MDSEVATTNKNEGKKYFGYAVCFGTIITFISGIGHVNSFGLIYNDFMKDTQSTAKSLTTAHGVFAIMLAFGGIILNAMTKTISLRLGGVIGALIFIAGAFTTIPISNTNQLPITFGVLQGIGFGIMVPVCYSTINQYYTKKRTTVMSLIKAIQGLVLMWYPQILKIIVQNYGFRGTLLLISGMSLHTIPGMLVMKQTMKRKKPANKKIETDNNGHENIDLLTKGTIEPIMENQGINVGHNLKSKMIEILHLKSFKDPIFTNICIGQSFMNFSDLMFFILLPMLLFQYEYDSSQVATCISICTAADVAGRCGLAVVSYFSHINIRLMYYVATLLTCILRIVIVNLPNYASIAITSGLLGVLRAWIHVASPLVISNHVTHEDFPGSYALFMLTAGMVNVTCSPLIGLLKDLYQDYIPAFYILSICCLPCLVTWPVEYIFRNKS